LVCAQGQTRDDNFFVEALVSFHMDAEDDAEEGGRAQRSYAVFHLSPNGWAPTVTLPQPWRDCPWRRPEAADITLNKSGAVVSVGRREGVLQPNQ
jgi:hypothetical protein